MLSGEETSRGRVCVAVAAETYAQAVQSARQVASHADVIEIRLDSLREICVAPFLTALATPLLFTNRPVWEGGRFADSEDARIAPLLEAVEQHAAYVDLELRAPDMSRQCLRRALAASSTRLILSWHAFDATPTRRRLVRILKTMRDQGAQVGKIVTMAHDFRDVLRVLQLQEDAARMDFSLIAFCMGRPGVISRLATLDLGGYMTYCSAGAGEETAPGQLSVQALRRTQALIHTKKC